MGIFDKIFPPKTRYVPADSTWTLMNGYTPIFNTWQGEMYESELVRAAIDSVSRHFAKIRVGFEGSAKPEMVNRMGKRPNDYQTWSQLLYRICTILNMQNTAFIIPVLGRYNEVTGITTMLPMMYELVEYDGELWIRFTDYEGKHASIELWRVGILTRYQYKSDIFGSDNTAMNSTMTLLDLQAKSIQEAVKNTNSYKFWARSGVLPKADDLVKEREQFSKDNFGGENSTGLLLFPSKYSEIKQIESHPYTVDYNTMQMIQNNVFNYFGTNMKIIQNTASSDELDSFFNGAIEPLIIQLQEVLTKMLYSDNEQSYGNKVVIDSNRIMYMTVPQKVSLTRELGDRGAILIDEIRELFNYPPLPNGQGQVVPVRGEYKSVAELLIAPKNTKETDETDKEV